MQRNQSGPNWFLAGTQDTHSVEEGLRGQCPFKVEFYSTNTQEY